MGTGENGQIKVDSFLVKGVYLIAVYTPGLSYTSPDPLWLPPRGRRSPMDVAVRDSPDVYTFLPYSHIHRIPTFSFVIIY